MKIKLFSTLKSKILFSLLFCFFIVAIPSFLLIYSYMNRLVYEQVVELNRYTMMETAKPVDTRLSSLIEAMAWMSTDESVVTAMNLSNMTSPYSRRIVLNAKEAVATYITATPFWDYVNKVVVYNDSGVTFAYTNLRNGSVEDVDKLRAGIDDSKLPNTKNGASVKLYFGTSLNSPFKKVLIARSKVANADAWVYAELDLSIFDPLFFSESARAVYVIADGFSYPSNDNLSYENNDYTRDEMNLIMPGTRVVWYTDYHPLTLSYSYGLTIFLIVLLGAVLLVTLLSIFFSNRVSNPISHLVKYIRYMTINESYGHVDASIEQGDDEIAKIGKTINTMSLSIANLLKKNEKLFEEKKNDEIKLLQMQVNPHFLYNTLESIKYLATVQKADGIASMSRGLSHLLKNIAKGRDDKIPLSEEIELLREYDEIQQVRYMGMYELCIDIPEEMLDVLIPKFTLQPLVENAIIHGIDPKGEYGEICVECREKDGFAVVSVCDNGIGMDEVEISHVFDSRPGDKMSLTGVGVRNVRDRMKLIYGTEASMRFESNKGEYTKAVVVFPIDRRIDGQV